MERSVGGHGDVADVADVADVVDDGRSTGGWRRSSRVAVCLAAATWAATACGAGGTAVDGQADTGVTAVPAPTVTVDTTVVPVTTVTTAAADVPDAPDASLAPAETSQPGTASPDDAPVPPGPPVPPVDPDAERARLDALAAITGPIETVVFMGDSIFSMFMEPGIHTLVGDGFADTPGLEDVAIETVGIAGQGTHFGLDEFVAQYPDWATLEAAATTFFGVGGFDGIPTPDLVVIAVSSVDLNVMVEHDVAEFAPAIIDALERTVGFLRSRDIEVVVVPVLPVSDELYDEHRGVTTNAAARVREFNRDHLLPSGLPVLFPHYSGFDADGDGRPDLTLFDGYLVELEGWTPDGVHPNELGQRAAARELTAELGRLILAVNSAAGDET